MDCGVLCHDDRQFGLRGMDLYDFTTDWHWSSGTEHLRWPRAGHPGAERPREKSPSESDSSAGSACSAAALPQPSLPRWWGSGDFETGALCTLVHSQ